MGSRKSDGEHSVKAEKKSRAASTQKAAKLVKGIHKVTTTIVQRGVRRRDY